jgi:hypothetical protein
MKRTRHISLSLSPAAIQALERVAESEDRSKSHIVDRMLRAGLSAMRPPVLTGPDYTFLNLDCAPELNALLSAAFKQSKDAS